MSPLIVVTVTVVTPADNAVTTPLVDTVAILLFALLKVTDVSDTEVGLKDTFSLAVSPDSILKVLELKYTLLGFT